MLRSLPVNTVINPLIMEHQWLQYFGGIKVMMKKESGI